MRNRVWDLPIRLFHWALVVLVAFSWWTAETGRDDWHFWSGYAVLFLLIFRLLWGIFGSSTARFASFVKGPAAVRTYLRSGMRWTAPGHTPLGALSVVALLLALIVQVVTGLFNVDEDGLIEGPLAKYVSLSTADWLHDVHEASFNVLLVLIGLHIAAIVFYLLVKKLNLVTPMISGRADLAAGVTPMRRVPTLVAVACAVAAFALMVWIARGLPPFGP
ncbi:cytochrome b/b6 domain-containing protein [Sphingomonas sabuli]|uniref:Cytochrome b/b6 domain-containing protein n=1 Tax=Sphingomonas sabuli TaxID=2764186 RepID=A0A7G9L553_9SPHN|nr:cytochrome b/b6 domain-containing protein [Sphingomonas sabuli]QNM83752.1 cytochrome b/b6 domain-containing protein [Sphingomonas sabuli]